MSVRRSEPQDASDGFEATEYPGGSPVDLVINPDDCETVYVIDAQQVWSSHDSGATWQGITGNLTEVPVRYRDLRTLEFVPAGEVFPEAAIAVGGRGGVQVMDVTREGEWYDLGGELPDVPVFDLDYDVQDRVLVAGTLGRGAWLVLSSAPIRLGVIGEQVLEIGDDVDLDVSALFYSVQGTLTYTVESSDPSVASATVAGTDVSVTTLRAGAVTITITATDGDGLTGTYTFTATVGTVASFDAAPDPVPEGAAVTLTIKLNRAVESTIDIDYTVVPGDAADTADADDRDHDLNAGTLSFAPGDTSGVIDIAINDDDEIEPVREAFTVQLQAPGDEAAWGIGLLSAVTVRINEGVCDRTPAIRDAIRRGEPCAGVSELDMASIHSLELEALGIVDLQSLDLLGLHALTRLELLNNPLTTLPEGLLGGLSRLTTLEIARNRLQTLPVNLFGDVSAVAYPEPAREPLADPCRRDVRWARRPQPPEPDRQRACHSARDRVRRPRSLGPALPGWQPASRIAARIVRGHGVGLAAPARKPRGAIHPRASAGAYGLGRSARPRAGRRRRNGRRRGPVPDEGPCRRRGRRAFRRYPRDSRWRDPEQCHRRRRNGRQVHD